MSPKSLAFLIRTPPLLLAFSAWRQVCTRFCFYASSAMTVSDYLDPATPDGPGTIYLPLILK
jgi:hypothetical protein